MILSNELTPSQIANAAGYHSSTITSYITNMDLFGSFKGSHIRHGRPRRLTPEMIKAFSDYLLEKPHLHHDESAILLYDNFGMEVPPCSISRAFKRER